MLSLGSPRISEGKWRKCGSGREAGKGGRSGEREICNWVKLYERRIKEKKKGGGKLQAEALQIQRVEDPRKENSLGS